MIVTVKVTVEPQCTDKQPHHPGEIVNVTCDATREPTEKQPCEGECTEKQPHEPVKSVNLTFDATREPTENILAKEVEKPTQVKMEAGHSSMVWRIRSKARKGIM